MKRIALAALALSFVAACAPKDEAPVDSDATAPAMAPAPDVPADSMMTDSAAAIVDSAAAIVDSAAAVIDSVVE